MSFLFQNHFQKLCIRLIAPIGNRKKREKNLKQRNKTKKIIKTWKKLKKIKNVFMEISIFEKMAKFG